MDQYGLINVAVGTPSIQIANPDHNLKSIVEICEQAYKKSVTVLALPELCLTGATCGDLFLQNRLLNEAMSALDQLADYSKSWKDLLVCWSASICANRIYNCSAAVMNNECLHSF